MTFRKFVFWAHLVAGVVSGLAIGVMCLTGTALAFEKELIAWSERDARRVEPSATAVRLPLEELQRRLREAHPEARPANIVLRNDPGAAVAFSAGRAGGYFVDPYSGEVRQPKSAAVGKFMQTMIEWHRYLGFTSDSSRPRGKWVNGACNIAFCLLAITGVYLWMPRSWSWRGLRPVVWFTQNSTSKKRDWNWHNVIGFWSAPVLIVLTLTAMPISFRWAGNLISTITGTKAPAAGAPGSTVAPTVEVPTPATGSTRLGLDALVEAAQRELPRWDTLTLRTESSALAGRGPRSEPAAAGTPPSVPTAAPSVEPRSPGGESRAVPSAVTFTIREAGSWPRTAATTLSLDPFTGAVLRRQGYADLDAARQVRAWTRFLHTGEAVGPAGQIIAGVASLGGGVLVWTGLALAFRRFFVKSRATVKT